MADVTPMIPLPGSWTASGSDRDYDWIGPDSTIPGAGFVFEMFDRHIPFTALITALRRFLGAGTDSLDGPVELQVADCGQKVVARGIELLPRIHNRFVGTKDLEGMTMRIELVVQSPTVMHEFVTWGMDGRTLRERMPADAQQAASKAGVELDLDNGFVMESDEPVVWTFSGDEAAARDALLRCCDSVWLAYLHQVAYLDGFSSDELVATAVEGGWDLERLNSAVSARGKLAVTMIRGDQPLMATLATMGEHIVDLARVHAGHDVDHAVAGNTATDGTVTVTRQRETVVHHGIMEHERVHQRQIEEVEEAWDPDGPFETAEDEWIDLLVNDMDHYAALEVEAYEGGIQPLEDWIADNCPRHAPSLPVRF